MRTVAQLLKSRFGIWCIALLAICSGVCACDRDKYLAAAGPKPLRFASEVSEYNPAWLLPKLDMGGLAAVDVTATEKLIDKPAEATPEPPAEAETLKSNDVPETNTDPRPEHAAELSQPLPADVVPSENSGIAPLSAQTLLRFFTGKGTNEVVVPYDLEFTPPVRPAGKGSSAEYISE